MICPECNKEMKAGTTTFIGTTGLDPMTCNFTADEEKDKSFFKRKTISITALNGFEYASYGCEDCKIVMPVIK